MAYKIKKVSKDRERRDFSKNENSLELKDLLEIQKKSYDLFITEGIKEVLDDMFPVENFSGSLSLEIVYLITKQVKLRNKKYSLEIYH